MDVDLLIHLRCPNPHDESGLVAAAARTAGRRILAGTLGCPVCDAEYPVRNGAVWFREDDPAPQADAFAGADPAEEATRLAALLAVDDRGGLYVLCGGWSALAGAIAEFERGELLLVAPTADHPAASTIRGTGDTLPLAAASVRGVAMDRPSAALAEAAARVLRARGRLVAPSGTPVPARITVLAGDARHWVGERDAAPAVSAPVTPRRAAPRRGSR